MDKMEFNKLLNNFNDQSFSHAYVIETNNITKCIKDLNELIKNILTKNKTENETGEINKQIDLGMLNEYVTVYPEENTIKKEQIAYIQERFLNKPTLVDYNVYVIIKSDKMNLTSANALLKFLEEPENNIIGFLITNNQYLLLPTIKSRCEIIKVNYDNENISELLNITEDQYNEVLSFVIDNISLIETEKLSKLLINRKTFIDKIKEKEIFINFLKIMRYIYYLSIDNKCNNEELINVIKLINEKNNVERKVNKIKLIDSLLSNSVYNINIELSLDKLYIEMEKINE